MAKQFGTTWWGKNWLDSLAHIDFGNRLPRGARYARNGSVKSIDIKNGTISARVAGSRPTRLTKNLIILASLLQRKLDLGVIKIADECGLQVFPQKCIKHTRMEIFRRRFFKTPCNWQ